MPAQDKQIFAQHAPQWWRESGPFSPLHRLNPLRLDYIKRRICTHFERDIDALNALDGLSLLDVGCGGGLISEPLARLGADVTGIDRDAGAIDTAREHTKQQGLDIDYRQCEVADLSAEAAYDVVLALEVIEHVDDQSRFITQLAQVCRPGGIVIVSTLNKTWQSWLLGIIGAEYVLGWVPRGTHDWGHFLQPSTCARYMRDSELTPKDAKGIVFNPLEGEFEISNKDLKVNYIITAEKASRTPEHKKYNA